MKGKCPSCGSRRIKGFGLGCVCVECDYEEIKEAFDPFSPEYRAAKTAEEEEGNENYKAFNAKAPNGNRYEMYCFCAFFVGALAAVAPPETWEQCLALAVDSYQEERGKIHTQSAAFKDKGDL